MRRLLLALALLTSFAGFAQRKCGTMIVHDKTQARLLSQYPNGFKRIQTNIANEFASGQRVSTVYNIPVIVHIINNGEAIGTTSNISVAQVQSQIDVLNRDFRNSNTDSANTPGVFKGLRADVELNFCLAAVDKNGKVMAQPGIERINRKDSGWSTPPFTDTYIESIIKPKTSWDPNKYLNIWVLNIGDGILGYAQFPDNTAGLNGLDPLGGDANTDGVVILYNAFGSTGTLLAAYNKGRTATHEIGHFFGLLHIWGDANCGNDYCNDTPTQQADNSGCPSFPHVTCSNGPNGDMFMNYMDYVNDACMNMFSNDQKARVQAVMAANTIRRFNLTTSTVCNGNIAPVANFIYTPNPIVAGSPVTFSDASIGGIVSTWSWTFSGGSVTTSSAEKPVTVFNATGQYTVTLTVTNAYGTSTTTKTINVIAPAADFSYSPVTIVAGTNIQFTDLSTGSPTAWSWNFGGAGAPNTATVQNPSVQFLTAGNYTVTLSATNATGSYSVSKAITVVTPVANFTYTPLNVRTGTSVTFTDISTGAPTSWSWNFGGGGTPNTSTAQNPSIVFSTAGTYNVTLSAANPSGSYSVIKTVRVNPFACLDTLTNFSGADTLYPVTFAGQTGYIAGHNSFLDRAKADKFTFTDQTGKLSKLIFYFGKKKGTGSIKATVWNANGTGGRPSTVLSTQTVSIASLADAGLPTVITLPTPLSITANYYVGIELTYASGDTVALITNKSKVGNVNTAWEKLSNNSWYAFTDASNSWGDSLSYKIFPVFDNRPAIAVTPTSITQCQGTPVTLTASGANTYSWSPATTLDAAAGASVKALPGSNTTYTITGTGTNGCTNTTTVAVNITTLKSPASTPAATAVCSNFDVGNGSNYSDGNCNEVAKIIPSGSVAVSGSINTCSKLESAALSYLTQPYVQRHFDIQPAANANNATGTVTLYFTDADFVAYNTNRGAYPALPTLTGGGNTDPAKANLFVTQYHGTSTTGLPGTYNGTTAEINPDDNNIVWNATMNAWEVTFNVTGFSGFFVHTPLVALPITMEYIKGQRQGTINVLAWKSNCMSTSVKFEIERSNNIRDYVSVGSITATQARCSMPFDFTDNHPLPGTNYYRLKMTEIDGNVSYSKVISLYNAANGIEIISLVPTLVSKGNAMLNVSSAKDTKLQLLVTDVQGRLLQTITANLTVGDNILPLNFSKLATGTYNISGIAAEGKTRTIRFVKQ